MDECIAFSCNDQTRCKVHVICGRLQPPVAKSMTYSKRPLIVTIVQSVRHRPFHMGGGGGWGHIMQFNRIKNKHTFGKKYHP